MIPFDAHLAFFEGDVSKARFTFSLVRSLAGFLPAPSIGAHVVDNKRADLLVNFPRNLKTWFFPSSFGSPIQQTFSVSPASTSSDWFQQTSIGAAVRPGSR
jgi:hypothetical protein